MTQLSFKKLGDGFPLVLVHGYLGGQNVWKNQEVLSRSYQLVMPSLAGYGDSSDRIAPATIRENAEQIYEFLDFLGINQFYLLGHSMGGMIVQEMSVLKPERVKKLICFGTGSIGVLPNRFEPIAESRRKIMELGLDATRQHIAKTWFVDHTQGDGYELCMDEAVKATEQAALASLAAWETWDGQSQLDRISAPTLILWAKGDRSYDWQQQQILLNGITNSRLEVIEGCAHNAHMERPELVNGAIEQFLD